VFVFEEDHDVLNVQLHTIYPRKRREEFFYSVELFYKSSECENCWFIFAGDPYKRKNSNFYDVVAHFLPCLEIPCCMEK
jgi:hypothetical protein